MGPQDSPQTTAAHPTRFVPLPGPDPAAVEAFEKLYPDVEVLFVSAVALPESPTNEHGCPGQIEHWYWVSDDGAHHVSTTVWYECEHHLEIVAEGVIP